MRGLESRCCLAMARVVQTFDVETSEIYAHKAVHSAYETGIHDHANGQNALPVMFADEPALADALGRGRGQGRELAVQEADVGSFASNDVGSYDVNALIQAAEKEAAHGCGQSYELYERRMQDAYERILQDAHIEQRQATEAALRARGYDPDFVPYEAQEGECSLTGIDENCCPCGRHE